VSGARRVNRPRPARVRAGPGGAPAALGGVAVESVREEWVVEEGWWTERPIRRHYYELALADGRAATVYRDLRGGAWCSQRA
jgi:hypothetical protein